MATEEQKTALQGLAQGSDRAEADRAAADRAAADRAAADRAAADRARALLLTLDGYADRASLRGAR